jgi:K+-transporting ATPase ATPase C chain
MLQQSKIAIRMLLLFTLVCGVAYPSVVTGLAQGLFPRQAGGSLVRRHGHLVGSTLIGQRFRGPNWFHGRPSAVGYDAAASGPSNYGPTSPALRKELAANLAKVLRENPGVRPAQVPVDLVTSSGSGLDPDLSPGAALLQVPRVARANHLSAAAVRGLVLRQVRGRWLGIFGEPHVNVLRLNLALDGLRGR